MELIKPPDFTEVFPKFQYFTRLTEGFTAKIEKASDLLYPFAKKEGDNVSYTTAYFVINGDDDGEHDCCDNDECIAAALNDIKGRNPDAEIEQLNYLNDGDHESLNKCWNCGRALNTQLTWVRDELNYLQEDKEEWDKEFFIREAFTCYCILQATPSNDEEISDYSIHQASLGNAEPLERDLKDRLSFYSSINEMVDSIIKCLENNP